MQVLCIHCNKFFKVKTETVSFVDRGRKRTSERIPSKQPSFCSRKCRKKQKEQAYDVSNLRARHARWYQDQKEKEFQYRQMLGLK